MKPRRATGRFELGLLAVLLFVLLRISLGWHFLYQGVSKAESGSFSSAGFLRQAKGPLADSYRGMIPDYYGKERLSRTDPPDGPPLVIERWKALLNQTADARSFTAEQREAAEKALALRTEEIDVFFTDSAEPIEDYLHELSRLEAASQEPTKNIPYQRKRIWDKQKEVESLGAGLLSEVDAISAAFEADLDTLLTPDQRALSASAESKFLLLAIGVLALCGIVGSFLEGAHGASRGTNFTLRSLAILVGLPAIAALVWWGVHDDLAKIDRLVLWSNLAIGFCLLAGLFTRLACIAGGLFLLSIVAAQPEWPTIYPPAPAAAGRSLIVNKEFIEMLVMFTLAATAVGRWAGLDFFVSRFLGLLFGRRTEP